MAAPDSVALAKLSAVVGDRLIVGGPALDATRTDKSGWWAAERGIALVEPISIDEVQAIVRIAAQHAIPLVPRGAGTGLAGGATATAGAIVLSLARMNRILEIALDDEIAVVEPGVINQHLSDALAPYGYVFSPDPASKAISSIGGNIATNAGGLLCAKYGVTREAVLGLTVVLPDGSLLETGRRTVKGVAGYDLTALLTGSEGTLGVIVRAVVKIRPIPPGDIVTIAAYFSDITVAAAACAAVTAARIRPALMELMDAPAVAAVSAYVGRASTSATEVFVLLQTDGGGAETEAVVAAEVLTAAGAASLEVTADAARAVELLKFRRSFHAALEAGGEVLIEDVCVPRSALPAMFATIREIAAAHELSIPTVAHAGDGNLHPNFVIPTTSVGGIGEGEVPDVVWAAAGELFQACVRLGGTLTGEHGVGVLKRRWLEAELGADGFALQRRIKAVFDPDGIMNPGKVY